MGEHTYYDDAENPTGFERNNVLFNYPEFGDQLIIGKFCGIASGTKFIMGPANHRLCSVTTYPFQVFGGAWSALTPAHLAQLPFKGDTVVGNDVWIGRESVIMPGVKIGDGTIIAAYSVVAKDVPPYTVFGGNPARLLKQRFDGELTELLLKLQWWNLEGETLLNFPPAVRWRSGKGEGGTAPGCGRRRNAVTARKLAIRMPAPAAAPSIRRSMASVPKPWSVPTAA